MPLIGDDRGTAVYNVVASQPGFDQVTTAERSKILAQLKVFFGADTGYLTANATLVPGTFASPAGQGVQVNTGTGTGSTNAPGPLTGQGKLT